MRKTVLATVVFSGVLLGATASIAASDYYLKIEGVEGETATRAKGETIELQSWSFGASQMGTTAASKNAMAAAEPATVSEARTVAFDVPEPGPAATAELARMCASGKHIKSAVLSSPNGRYQLKDAVVTSCKVYGNQRRYELKGHVTLMK